MGGMETKRMNEDTKRWFLFMVIVLATLWAFMPKQTAPQNKTSVEQSSRTDSTTDTLASVEETTSTATAAETVPEPAPVVSGREVVFENGTYRVVFTTAGGVPKKWEIVDPTYAKASQQDVDEAARLGRPALHVGDPLPIGIIPDYGETDESREYPLTIVLKEAGGKYFDIFNRSLYTVTGPTKLADGSEVLTFVSPVTPEGLRLTKTYRFTKGRFLTDLHLQLDYSGGKAEQNMNFGEAGRPGLGLTWGPGIGEPRLAGGWAERSYGVAVRLGDGIASDRFGKWRKVAQGETMETRFEATDGKRLGWVALESRFYMTAIVPQSFDAPLARGVVRSQNVPSDKEILKNMSPPFSAEVYSGNIQLHPGEKWQGGYSLYVGPKKRELLAAIDRGHDYELRTIMFHQNMRLIRWLAIFMLSLLEKFYTWTKNYGVAIILLVLVMRLLTQPFSHIGMKHMARVGAEQQRIKPLIDAINEKFKDDPEKRNAEIWKTYREHGINPLGMFRGCLWLLIQMPIFFALYTLLLNAIDLRGASFLWIHDLTAEDALFTFPFSLPLIGTRFNLIPILMGISQLFAQRLQTSTQVQDPAQKQMAMMMPIMFIFILYKFPAGLSLYWFVSNIWQIVFQVVVNRRVRQEAEEKARLKFEARFQQKIEQVVALDTSKKSPQAGSKGWVERVQGYFEKMAKEEERKRRGGPKGR
jgi:YidC/Oxa1 family membrane protein insertase